MEFERRRHNHAHMNIAPLVDVVFLLLLFFMLTSHFVQEPSIKIKLPDSQTAETTTETERTIMVAKTGEIYFMDKRVDLENLRMAIQETGISNKSEFLRIKSDKEADVGLLVSVIDEVKLAGVTNFSIVTKRR
ncbi:MAG: biopolymer transporter ExbD [Thermodesulfovibrionales bacterium]|nr:biopolymer transporter ExbD [Thermodesulfovibrionales bacterium]